MYPVLIVSLCCRLFNYLLLLKNLWTPEVWKNKIFKVMVAVIWITECKSIPFKWVLFHSFTTLRWCFYHVCDYHTASSCGVVLLYINFKNADSPKNLQHKRKGFLTAKFSLIYMKRILSNWVFTHICTLWGCNSILSILLKRTKMPVMAPKLLHTWILDCYASSLNIRTQNPEK